MIDVLWPDALPESVANRLHKAAHFIRKATGVPGSIVLASGTAALFPSADLEIDAATFERLAADGLAALGELIKVSWGSDQPGFRQVYDARFLPDGPIESWRAFDELQRRSTSPRNAYRLWRAFGSLDCAEAARQLDVPTLILHPSDDRVWSFQEAEELHAMVAGSRLVPLPSSNHILRSDEPAFATFIEEVEHFVAG